MTRHQAWLFFPLLTFEGINLHVAWSDGAWLTATGNSFAAPHITGHVARILGKHPGLAPFQIKVILRALSANVRAD